MIYNFDCRTGMRLCLADNSVDAIVTDPPYELGFMGKAWDASGIANNVEMWREALRVLKPGGHLLAFSGSRTYHRMVCAIEDAGFGIRDQIMWIYGSGFPKSLDVSKAIDNAGGSSPREQAAILSRKRTAAGMTRGDVAARIGCTVASVRDWEEGRARAAGAAVEFIIPSSAYRAKLADLLGYSADERRVIGASIDRRDDGTVYGVGHSGVLRTGGATDAARQWDGWGTALKPAHEPIVVARKPLVGTVAANVLAHGTGALNIDGCRVGDEVRTYASSATPGGNGQRLHGGDGRDAENAIEYGAASKARGEQTAVGRWPANLIHDGSDEVIAAFPDAGGQQGALTGNEPSARPGAADQVAYGAMDRRHASVPRREEDRSAARFFYCAKASKADRGEGNTHPTVKPAALMQYLCRLVTPPGGLILDPFTGSGSTWVAAKREGFEFVGFELDPAYIEIATRRADAAHDSY